MTYSEEDQEDWPSSDNREELLAKIKSQNPVDVTNRDLNNLRLLIEEEMKWVNELQQVHRELVGKSYKPFI